MICILQNAQQYNQGEIIFLLISKGILPIQGRKGKRNAELLHAKPAYGSLQSTYQKKGWVGPGGKQELAHHFITYLMRGSRVQARFFVHI